MSNLTGVLSRPGFKYEGTVTVYRTSVGTDDGHGRYVPGTVTSFVLTDCSVQPIGSSLKVLPEGYSAEDGRRIITTTRLQKLPIPDVVDIDGEQYAVSRVDGPWTAFGGTHWNVTVFRVSSPGEY